MDDARVIDLLYKLHMKMLRDPHLQGHPQVRIQHIGSHLSDKWRVLRDANRL